MEKENNFINEKVVKLRIPDGDVVGWMEVLRGSGLDDEQIDEILSGLNKTYVEKKGMKNDDLIEEELKKSQDRLLREHGKVLSQEEKNYLRKGIESRFK